MTRHRNVSVVVPGGLNTDIIGLGVDRLIGPGELSYGGRLVVGPGGKSANVARMAATFMGRGSAAMIGVTVRDPLGLWRFPLDGLKAAGVVTRYVTVERFDTARPRFPGVALIPVDGDGINQIYVLPGINETLSPGHIDRADALFRAGCVLVLTLEMPLETVRYALSKAHERGMRVILDPGGIGSAEAIDDILDGRIFLVKPNEHEAAVITGVGVSDLGSAEAAAASFHKRGITNVLITHGARGAYLFINGSGRHIPAPRVPEGPGRDETGCGDQTTAVLAALIAEGAEMVEAARLAVRAGTLHYHRIGIDPVGREEIEK
jgi:ribokinase